MEILIVVVILMLGFVLLLFLLSGSKATARTMLASYYAAREKLGQDISEREILFRVLRLRPPFNSYSEDAIWEIIDICPDIESLIAFVISFDKKSHGIQ